MLRLKLQSGEVGWSNKVDGTKVSCRYTRLMQIGLP